jgi:two-component system chemotaxis response regulator CheB
MEYERLARSRVLCFGASWGGLAVFKNILPCFSPSLPVPVVIVQHSAPDSSGLMIRSLQELSRLPFKEIEDKEKLKKGYIYVAPPDYHVLVEPDESFSLSVEDPVCYSRPSIDVLFDSVADIYGASALGVLLSGANADGAKGLKSIHDAGGWTWVQRPDTAQAPEMPMSALELKASDLCLSPQEMSEILGRWSSSE